MDAVLNWVWQGAIVAAATALVLRAMQRSRPQMRYRALWAAMLSIVVLPVVPALWAIGGPVPQGAVQLSSFDPVMSLPAAWWTSSAVLFGAWAVWCGVFSARVAAAVVALRRAKRACEPFPAHVETRLASWNRLRQSGRQTELVLSSSVRSAAVLGGRRPVIAIAPALLQHLDDRELDRIVVHEWAHVQRRDDLAQVPQLLVRVLAGWHPAVWWCDRQLRLERELACDDTAVAQTGSTKEYAACLARVASLPAARVQRLPVAVGLSSSVLRRRIVRILRFDRLSPRRAGVAGPAVAATVLLLIALSVGNVRAFIDELPPREAGSPARSLNDEGQTATPAPQVIPVPVPVFSGTPRQQRRPVAPGGAARGAQTTPVAAADEPGPAGAATADGAPAIEAALPSTTSAIAAAAFDSHGPSLSTSGRAATTISSTSPSSEGTSVSPWRGAADAGAAIGRSSRQAATATAGIFTTFSRKIAASF